MIQHTYPPYADRVMRQAYEAIHGALLRAYAHLTDEERGASIVEYSLLIVLIAIVALIAVTVAGSELSETYSDIGSGLTWAGDKT